MTLQEAIEIGDLWVNNKPVFPHTKLHVAVRLLIEAGKRQAKEKREIPAALYLPLPGETEE